MMIDYLIKSLLIQTLLFGVFWVILRNRMHFNFNRAFLIISLIGSLVIPLISIPTESVPVDLSYVITVVGDESALGILPSKEGPKFELSALIIIGGIYLIGVLMMGYRLVRSLVSLKNVLKKSPTSYFESFPIIVVEGKVMIHSFFKSIIVSKSEFEKGIDTDILRHESVHLRQFHTLDVVFLEVVQILMWFNPFLILFKKAMRLNHEFLADKFTSGGAEYARKIINYSKDGTSIQLASTFNYSFIKKRIKMLKKQKSNWFIGMLSITASFIFGFVILSSFSKTGEIKGSEYNFRGSIEMPSKIDKNGYQAEIKNARIHLDIDLETMELRKWKVSFSKIDCRSSGELVVKGNTGISFLFDESSSILNSKIDSKNLMGTFVNKDEINGVVKIRVADENEEFMDLGSWTWSAKD